MANTIFVLLQPNITPRLLLVIHATPAERSSFPLPILITKLEHSTPMEVRANTCPLPIKTSPTQITSKHILVRVSPEDVFSLQLWRFLWKSLRKLVEEGLPKSLFGVDTLVSHLSNVEAAVRHKATLFEGLSTIKLDCFACGRILEAIKDCQLFVRNYGDLQELVFVLCGVSHSPPGSVEGMGWLHGS